MSANEASSIGSLRSILTSQHNFAATASRGGYAPDLPRLGVTCPASTVPFMSSDLTTAVTVLKSGFDISSVGTGAAGPPDCNGNPTVLEFHVTAVATLSRCERLAFVRRNLRGRHLGERRANGAAAADPGRDVVAVDGHGAPTAVRRRMPCVTKWRCGAAGVRIDARGGGALRKRALRVQCGSVERQHEFCEGWST